MAECMIKTIKHGITVLAATPGNVDCWDEHLVKILFGTNVGSSTISAENGAHCKHPRKCFAQCGASIEATKEDLCHPER